MITLFTCPKPFSNSRISLLQRNAIKSWKQLDPTFEIIIFGSDEGTLKIADELKLRCISNLACNEFGTPLVNDLFERAQQCAHYDVLCYVNADIILMSDFIQSVKQVISLKRDFLMVGCRWDLDIDQALDFQIGWEQKLKIQTHRRGRLHEITGIDYFVFPKGLWGKIPPFALGRTAWDNWLLYRARAKRSILIDASRSVFAVHQNHDYSHVVHSSDSEAWVWKGAEAKKNVKLAGGVSHFFSLADATHYLITPCGIRLDISIRKIMQHVHTLTVLHPALRIPGKIITSILKILKKLKKLFLRK